MREFVLLVLTLSLGAHGATRDYVVMFNPAAVEVVRAGLKSIDYEILQGISGAFVVRGPQKIDALRVLPGVTHVERNARVTAKSCVQAVGH